MVASNDDISIELLILLIIFFIAKLALFDVDKIRTAQIENRHPSISTVSVMLYKEVLTVLEVSIREVCNIEIHLCIMQDPKRAFWFVVSSRTSTNLAVCKKVSMLYRPSITTLHKISD